MLPPHDQSAMDGFALRLRPTERPATSPPAVRRVVGRSAPGDDYRRRPVVGFDTAVEVLTGANLPAGANAVIRSENSRRSRNRMWVRATVAPGQDVARRGEDFRPGSRIIAAGTRVRPWHLAALVANQVRTIPVLGRPRAGVLATGSEIVPAGSSGHGSAVRDSTKPLLLGLLQELGIAAVDLGRAPDRENALRSGILRGLARCDLVITIGGSSVGVRDRVPSAVGSIPRARWIARHVRLRPGSTTSVAVVGPRPMFVLPGPPVAAFAGFLGLVEPFLRARGFVVGDAPRAISATLERAIVHARGVRELVRVRIRVQNGVRRVFAVERHGAARLSSLTDADGLLVLEERRGAYRAGETVRVVPFDDRTDRTRRPFG